MKIPFACFVLQVISLIGCSEHKPEIPGCHWNGGELYNSSGIEVASVVAFPFDEYPSQACVFIASNKEPGCTYWETSQEAYDHIGIVFK